MKAICFACILTALTLPQSGCGDAGAHQDIIKISNQGEEVHLEALISSNKVTVVDFYADWCGPCKAIAPHLEQMAKEDGQVQLVKIDIQSFESPVAKQFKLQAIPNLRVYDTAGNQVGKDGSSFGTVKLYVKKAKRKMAE